MLMQTNSCADTHAHPRLSRTRLLTKPEVPIYQNLGLRYHSFGRHALTQSVKPVIIKQSAYLRVPNDVAELLDIMGAPTGAVERQIDEKGCALVYTFSKQKRTVSEEPESVEPLISA